MSGVKFTDEQLAAVEARDCDLLVSAAAGSGKTAVLTERIIRLISEGEDPCDIDRILVVTFTRAAAAGMRERIAKALSDRIGADPANVHLRRQEMLLPHAKIMTIDAFCQYLLRNNFESVGLDPSFRVSDEGEMKLLCAETLGEVLEACYAAADEEENRDFLHCTEVFSVGATDEQLEDEILKLYRFSESMPWPELWLKAQREALCSGPENNDQIWISLVIKRIRKVFDGAAEALREALAIVRSPGGPWMYEDTITDDIKKITAIAEMEDYRQMQTTLYGNGGIAFGRLSVKRDDAVDPRKRDRVKEIRNKIKDLLKKDIDRYFSDPPEEILSREREADRALAELIRLVLLFRARLNEKKREKNLIDFSDMEHLALRVLAEEPASLSETTRPTAIAAEYAEFFREIMIDEYQDSNFVQETLLGAIAHSLPSCRRFMVGDVKQSIYRFRLARPEIFMDKFARYDRSGASDKRRIDLHRNFRSRRQILELVNEIFAAVMRADIGGVDYDDDAMLRAGGEFPEPEEESSLTPELMLLLRDDPDIDADDGEEEEEGDLPDEESGESVSAEQAEAQMIADRIRELLSCGVVQDGDNGFRRVRFGDIVILLRATSGVDEIYRDVLTANGIPVHIESKTGYFQAREVRALTDLLAVLENPLRDIPFAGVLRSLIGGFTDEELAQIRTCDMRRGHAFYEAFLNTITNAMISDTLRDKCQAFLLRLKSWREAAGRMPVGELLDRILAETGYMERIAAMPAGARRRANVRMLLIRAAEFERSGGHGIAGFAARIEQYRRVEVDFGEANELSEDADLVRIMSIHKSKGLEYPIVFAAGLSRAFNRMDERAAVLADETVGLGSFAVDLERRVKQSSMKRFVIADKLHEESLGEELRVLYVAMTRAKEKLILTAGVNHDRAASFFDACREAEAAGRPSAALSYLRRSRATSFADLLLDVLPACVSPFSVKTVEKNSLLIGRHEEETTKKQRKIALTESVNTNNNDSYFMQKVLEKLDHSYAHSDLARLFVKTTVTELKERILAEEGGHPGENKLYGSTEETEIVPMFLREEKPIRGAQRGTAYHKVMELLDAEILDNQDIPNHDLIIKNRNTVYKWMKKREQDRLPKGDADVVRPEDVLTFLTSGLGQRFTEAFRGGRLFREKQFMMSLEARRVSPELPAGETVLLQGVVDVWFIEDNAIILLDYKTDRLGGDVRELAEKYGVQLALYAEALERITGLPVKEKWIWSFAAGCAVPVDAAVTVSPPK
ncbi:MAG: helicase-exonuclease AddAB subunit AddA [Lachnospiraceae bacterium]|nr:helicase-exonuclease AddAB subunit AddA [Lachnospiraceae bacterium]